MGKGVTCFLPFSPFSFFPPYTMGYSILLKRDYDFKHQTADGKVMPENSPEYTRLLC